MSSQAVIILHGIGTPQRALEPGEDRFWLSQAEFDRALDMISKMGADAPQITFDDGNLSDIAIAAPALAGRGLKATFYLLAGRLDSPGSLTSKDVVALARAGHRIGLHGKDHVDWRRLDASGRRAEFQAARDYLADLANAPIEFAAAPFGLYDRQTVNDLRALGFAALYTSDRGLARSDAFIRPRNCLESGMDATTLSSALRGHLPPLRAARRVLGVARKRLFPMRLRA